MSLSPIDLIAAGAATLAVWMCGVTRLPVLLRGLAVQTALLACVSMLLGLTLHERHFLVLAGMVLGVKAVAIPSFLAWAARRLEIPRDAGASLSPTLALWAGCALLGISYFLAPQIAAPAMGQGGTAGVALALLLTGMLVMITRRLALSQVVGFLVLENGIFLYGLTQTHGMPLLVEMGIVFEVLVGVMIAGTIAFRMNRSFEHVDVTQLRGLRH